MSHRFGTLRTWQGTSNSEILKMARSCHLPQVPSSPNHWRLPKSWGYPKWMVLFHGQSMYKWTKYGVPPLKWKLPYGWDEEAHPAIFFLFFPMLKGRLVDIFLFYSSTCPEVVRTPMGEPQWVLCISHAAAMFLLSHQVCTCWLLDCSRFCAAEHQRCRQASGLDMMWTACLPDLGKWVWCWIPIW